MARWSSGLRLRPLTPATRVRISYGSPLWATKEKKIVGVYSDEGPPVPIPNTAVKLISAENTWGAAPWEDRATPTFLYASIAQSVEHAAVNRGVTGSSPVWGAKEKRPPCGGLFSFPLASLHGSLTYPAAVARPRAAAVNCIERERPQCGKKRARNGKKHRETRVRTQSVSTMFLTDINFGIASP